MELLASDKEQDRVRFAEEVEQLRKETLKVEHQREHLQREVMKSSNLFSIAHATRLVLNLLLSGL